MTGNFMRVLISHTHKYIYHMNPKVGSNTTLNMLYRIAGLDEAAIGNPHQTSRDVELLKKHGLLAKDMRHDDCQAYFAGFPNHYTFSFTRNPYTRLKSAYNDKLKRYAEIVMPEVVDELGQRDSGLSKNQFQQELKKQICFRQFAEGVCKDHLYGDQHWVPQYDRLRPDLCHYNSLGKLENYMEDMTAILEAIGISKENQPEFPTRLNSAPDPRLITDYFDDHLIRLVRNSYHKDFETFSYSTILPL
jgi:hypothetical protein